MMFTVVVMWCSVQAGCEVFGLKPPVVVYDRYKECIEQAEVVDDILEEEFPELTIFTTCAYWGELV